MFLLLECHYDRTITYYYVKTQLFSFRQTTFINLTVTYLFYFGNNIIRIDKMIKLLNESSNNKIFRSRDEPEHTLEERSRMEGEVRKKRKGLLGVETEEPSENKRKMQFLESQLASKEREVRNLLNEKETLEKALREKTQQVLTLGMQTNNNGAEVKELKGQVETLLARLTENINYSEVLEEYQKRIAYLDTKTKFIEDQNKELEFQNHRLKAEVLDSKLVARGLEDQIRIVNQEKEQIYCESSMKLDALDLQLKNGDVARTLLERKVEKLKKELKTKVPRLEKESIAFNHFFILIAILSVILAWLLMEVLMPHLRSSLSV